MTAKAIPMLIFCLSMAGAVPAVLAAGGRSAVIVEDDFSQALDHAISEAHQFPTNRAAEVRMDADRIRDQEEIATARREAAAAAAAAERERKAAEARARAKAVESVDVRLKDGTVVHCSRSEYLACSPGQYVCRLLQDVPRSSWNDREGCYKGAAIWLKTEYSNDTRPVVSMCYQGPTPVFRKGCDG